MIQTKTFFLLSLLIYYLVLLLSFLPETWGSFLGIKTLALYLLQPLGLFTWVLPPFCWLFEKQRRTVPRDEILFLLIGYFLLLLVFFALFPSVGGVLSQIEQQWLQQHFSEHTRLFFLICLTFVGFFLAFPHPNAPHPATRHLPLLSRTIFPTRYLLPPLSLLTVSAIPKSSPQTRDNLQQLLYHLKLPADLTEEPEIDEWKCFSIAVTPEEGKLLLAHTENLSVSIPGIRIFYPLPQKNTHAGIQIPVLTKKILRYSDLVSEKQPLPLPSPIWLLGNAMSSGERVLLDLNQPILVTGNAKTELASLLKSFFLSIWMHQNPLQIKILLCDASGNFEINPQEPHFLGPIVRQPAQICSLFQWLITQTPPNDEKWIVVVNEFDPLPDIFPEIEILLKNLNILPMLWIHHPTPQVITTELKELYPQRICLQVNSSFDSRMVLERNGAEELKGQGDFYLFRKTHEAILRGQSISVDPQEWNQIQNDWIRQGLAQWHPDLRHFGDFAEDSRSDPYLEKAVRVALSTQRISVALLMNRFQMDASYAEKLISLMEKEKIIERQGDQFFTKITLKEWETHPLFMNETRKS